MNSRLAMISNLEDGWYNGDCLAISKDCIADAQKLLDECPWFETLVAIFPSLDGGVLFDSYSMDLYSISFAPTELTVWNDNDEHVFSDVEQVIAFIKKQHQIV